MVFTPNAEQRSVINETLRKFGYSQITDVSSPMDAFNALSEQLFDAIISDVELDTLDGWRFARLIRSGALNVNENIPIILMSSSYSERIAEATARSFQINRFVPFRDQHTLPLILDEIFSNEEVQDTPKPTLLVIEDYPDTVELVKRVLRSRFDISVAITGKEGLEKWKERRHSLVLLDVMLPEMSGNEVLKEILKISPQQSVVMMTARSTPERAGQLIIDGAVDFISKPFRTEQLRRVCEIAEQREDFMVSNHEFALHQEALFHEKELAQITLQSIADGVITTDIEGNIDFMNTSAERLSGWTKEEAEHKRIYQILNSVSGDLDKPVQYDPAAECLEIKRPIHGSRAITFLNRDGRELNLDHVTSPLRNRKNEIIGSVMVFRDVTEAQYLEKKLEYQANHDALTGLTNRAAFEERLHIVLDNQLHHEVEYALCYIDLDQFKIVNDTCGHVAGDQLLRQIKTIIMSKIRRKRDTLARFGGDEFVLLLEDCSAQYAVRIAQDICDAIQAHQFIYDNKTFAVGASIGVVPITLETRDVNDALRMADNACYVAKEKGRNRVHVYHVNDQELIKRRGEMHVVSKINHAIENDGFGLFHQVIKTLDPNSNSGKHIEILLRMKNEEGEWISPGFFLPAAERYSVAPKVDRWVLQSTFNWFAEHRNALADLGMCSINLSGLSLADDSFVDFIAQQVNDHQLPPEKFCFEITETSAIHNLQEASEFIGRIKMIGCTFALDDFGSGMSSYAYLKNLPVDYLKIDGMFVRAILDDHIDHAMVRSINEIGHVFGLKTIAEYVENDEIMEELKRIGVDFVQGYAIHKPSHISDLLVSSDNQKSA